jgi:hypothetical protein
VEALTHTIPSAHFSLEGITIEVQPCTDEVGTWRARRVDPNGRRGPWERGRYAWQAMEAVTGKAISAG